MPFYTAKAQQLMGSIKDLFYFSTEAAALAYQKINGGDIAKTSPSPGIWRVAV